MNPFPDVFQFQSHEKVASVGCGGGVWEIGWALAAPPETLYLIDTDIAVLNDTDVEETISYWENHEQRKATTQFILIHNTEETIPLADHSLDKILVLNAFHEFSFPEKMLTELRRLLRINGLLFIEEPLAQYPGQVHDGCGKRLFQTRELITFIESAGFREIDSVSTSPDSQLFIFQTFHNDHDSTSSD